MRILNNRIDLSQKEKKTKPPDESGGCVIETKTNDCPSYDGKEIFIRMGELI